MIPLVVIGHLTLPDTARAAWHGARLDPAAFAWPEGPPLMQGHSPGEFATVGDLLAALDVLGGAPDYFELERPAAEVRGFLLPETVNRLHQDLATALREAGRHGGRGEVAFVAITEQAAFVLRIGGDDDAPEAEWMGSNQVFADDAQARRFVAEMEFVGAWDRDPTLRRADFLAAQDGLGLAPVEEQPHHRAVIARVLGASPAAAFAAMQGVTGRHDRPLSERYADAAALRGALERADPPARASAIELLAILEPTAALDHVEALLADPSEHVLRHTLRALGRIPDDGAFTRLLAFGGPRCVGFVQMAREAALADAAAPGADALVRAALDGPAFDAAAWSRRDRAADPTGWMAAVDNATALLGAVAIRQRSDAAARVLEIFFGHPVAAVRVAAANVLARLGGPIVEANTAPLQMALMGMGLALNQDDARRAALLGVDTTDESLGIMRFGGLDGERLRALVEEGFANPETSQNASPPIGAFLAMLTDHPELRVGGYSVPKSRADYRVSVDTVWIDDLDAVPAARRDAVVSLFGALQESATNVDPEGSAFRCWWT
jgi:hypothetical protein